MAIKAFNSVAGFSVGENPTNIILNNGDITTTNASISGNLVTNKIFTDNYFFANGVSLDFQLPSGSDYQIQYGNAGDFDSSANLKWNPDLNVLDITGKITTTGNITAPYFIGNVRGNIAGNLIVPGLNQAVLYNDQGIAGSSDAFMFDEVSNTLSLTGLINTTDITVTGNIIGTVKTAIQPNITSVGSLTSLTVVGNIDAPNVNVSNNIAVANNANVNGNLRVEDTATIATLLASGILYPTVDGTAGQLIATDGEGNLGFVTIQTDKLANGTSNIQILDSSNILISINGVESVTNFTETGIIVTGNITGTNNVRAGNIIANTEFVANNLIITSSNSSITGANVISAASFTGPNGSFTHTLTTANLNVTNNVTSNLLPNIDSILNLGNTTYKWNNIYLGGNLFLGTARVNAVGTVVTTANANVTNTLTTNNLNVTTDLNAIGNVTISGNLTVGGSTEYINVTNLSIKDPLILLGGDNSGANATVYDGKDRGLVLQNYRSDGIDIENQFFGWKTSDGEFVAASNVVDFSGEVVTYDRLANIKAGNFVGNISGTVLSSSQPFITSLGTLTGLTVAGDVSITGSTQIDILRAGILQYPTNDGLSGQVLTTNGLGALYFSTPVTTEISHGTSNVSLDLNGNVNVSVAGNPDVVVMSGSGINVAGYGNFAGNVNSSNLIASSNVYIGVTTIRHASTVTSSTLAGQIIASVSAVGIRGVEFFVKGEEDLGSKYSVASVSVVHNGSMVDYSVYGTVVLGGPTGVLAVAYNAESNTINLTVTPASSNTTAWTTQFKTI